MIQDPCKNLDRYQNLIDSSLCYVPPLCKTLSKSFITCLLRYAAKCEFMPSANGKEYWKMILDPCKNQDRYQNLIDSSLGHVPPLHKTIKIVHIVDILFTRNHDTHRQKDRHTHICSN